MEGHLEKLRKKEIETVRFFFSPCKRVLEIGGGSGYQAGLIAFWGCDVVSIDLPDRPVPQARFYPVLDYDGINIPFANESFDIIFSSNVLEHIQLLPPICAEMRRVLKAEGLAIHLVPSSAWRLWTNLSHYIYLLKRFLGIPHFIPGVANAPSATETVKMNDLSYLLKRMLIAGPHG
ncbi:MAG: class I SAM-dependent methyltransferase, partial [Pyrinomonadaceae bacterium]|nr:class I SAM-dependent methyltransferase [Pyrinomonadaceae bacterium]